MNKLLLAIVVATASMPATTLAQGALDGTWKVDKDSYSKGRKPASYVVDAGSFECVSCPTRYRIRADGRDHPVEGDPLHDTLAVRLPDARTVHSVGRKGGKVVTRTTLTISADGRTLRRQSTQIVNGHRSKEANTYTRVAAGAAGSHWLSGSWRRVKVDLLSESSVTFRTDGGTLSMSSPHGGSYTATLDGPPAPLQGDASGNSVSVKMKDSRTLEETAYRDGKPYLVTTMQVDPGGARANVSWTHLQVRAWEAKYLFVPDADGVSGSYTMTRQ